MSTSILITQCLQNDFVKPVGRFEPIPNLLHIGHSESLRLMGENPAEGPVARTMRWAYEQSDDILRVVHIRDWHDPDDAEQQSHLAQFGEHCVRESEGARFSFPELDEHGKKIEVVDSLTLNDFRETRLDEVLSPLANEPCRVGLVGVWTEAKISFLAYELTTRYPNLELAVCSALTASSSRQHHFEAVSQLERLLGVRVIDSVGEFVDWLGDGDTDTPLLGMHEKYPAIESPIELPDADKSLVRYLFRDCREVKLKILDGGFSGNLVAGTQSVDMHGHDQVPHVMKIGPQDEMGRERTSFERIQDVMGNNAPQISDFADLGNRGAIKYRYASMGGSFTATFQKLYQKGMPIDEVREVIDTVFGEQMMRLYKAATLEACDLLKHYWFDSKWAPEVQANVERIAGCAVPGDTVEILPGLTAPNPAVFYRDVLDNLPARAQESVQMSYIHGDLNGANILLDAHSNVWLIDFFHTRRAHVLMDLIKLESDLFYILTSVDTEGELREACKLTDAIMEVEDLAAELPETSPSSLPQMQRAWATLRMLRAYHGRLVHSNRDPLQLFVGLLRYAGHTLAFDEPNALQLKWALYTAGRCAEKVTRRLQQSTKLRVDWLEHDAVSEGRIGLSILPGRKDWKRRIGEDLKDLEKDGIGSVMCLVPGGELAQYGVSDLLDAYKSRGFQVCHLGFVDQMAASIEDMDRAVDWLDDQVASNKSVLIHCVGGLGRSGMAAACWLVRRGLSAERALEVVRTARGPRAVETRVQEALVAEYATHCGA
ncbi:MAG: protein-tyrosine phosphatase/nicotinamidase-related amidase [Planctomycetota bacterium]|jgi:protein-tyrosine phosphatase/nicotinamidase-related amidase